MDFVMLTKKSNPGKMIKRSQVKGDVCRLNNCDLQIFHKRNFFKCMIVINARFV